jgi:hypothetical protein
MFVEYEGVIELFPLFVLAGKMTATQNMNFTLQAVQEH